MGRIIMISIADSHNWNLKSQSIKMNRSKGGRLRKPHVFFLLRNANTLTELKLVVKQIKNRGQLVFRQRCIPKL